MASAKTPLLNPYYRLHGFSVHLSSVLGRTELCHEVWTPGPQKPQIISNENHHLALLEKNFGLIFRSLMHTEQPLPEARGLRWLHGRALKKESGSSSISFSCDFCHSPSSASKHCNPPWKTQANGGLDSLSKGLKVLKAMSLVAQIARCNRDVRCDSNRTLPNH